MDKRNCSKKGIQGKELIPKEDLVKIANLTNKEISDITGFSEYMVKKSLVHHGLYKGKCYELICDGCKNIFKDFTKNRKFCSNHCKHSKQTIWNKGLTKDDSYILKEASRRMRGNKLGKLVDYSKKNREDILLPNLNKTISYDKSSLLEKEWLLKVDNEPGVVDIVPSTLSFEYVDEFQNIKNYYPDYEVTWTTGIRWLVEVKGIATDKDYSKIEQISRWAKENRYDFKIITTGMVKRDTWNTVYSEYHSLRLASPEWIIMSWACAWSKLSVSPRLQVGAVITSMDCSEAIAYGYNGDERGGINVPTNMLPGQDGFIHAEENALLKMKTKDPCKMFITDMPCVACARRIINAGNIKEVYYLRPYRDASGVGMLMKAGIKVYHFQITDFTGNIYNSNDAYYQMLPGGMKNI